MTSLPSLLLGNLATHTRIHSDKLESASGPDQGPDGKPSSNPIDHGFTAGSAKIMEEYLLEGKLNPKLEPTRKGFLKVFAAWILQEDLPYTTGEAPGLKRLFEYLQIRFVLPSDTAVRNTLAEIFMTLHGTVVEELAVSV